MSSVSDLVQLQAVDREWDEKVRRFQDVRAELSDTSTLEAKRNEERRRQQALADASRELRDVELQIQTLRQKQRETDDALYGGRVRSPREVENLRKGSDQLRQQVSYLEDRALELMARIEELEAATSKGGAELEAFVAAYQQEHRALTAEYQQLRARLQELKSQREALRQGLSRNELALYDHVRATKSGVALAPIRNGVCQACHVSVPSNKVRAAEREEGIVTCEGCGRILYNAES